MEPFDPADYGYYRRLSLLKRWFTPSREMRLENGELILQGKSRDFVLTKELELLSLPHRGEVTYSDFQEWFAPELDSILLTDEQWEEVLDQIETPLSKPEAEKEAPKPFRPLRMGVYSLRPIENSLRRLKDLRAFASTIPNAERQRLARSGLVEHGLLLLQMVRQYPGFDRLLETEPLLAAAVALKADDHFKGWMGRRPDCLPADGKWKHADILEYLNLEGGMPTVRILRRFLPWQFSKEVFQQWILLFGRPEVVRMLSRLPGWLPAELLPYLRKLKGERGAFSPKFLDSLRTTLVKELRSRPGTVTTPFCELDEGILMDSLRMADKCSEGWARLSRVQSVKGLVRLHDAFVREYGWMEAAKAVGGEEKLKAMIWEPPFPETEEFKFIDSPGKLREAVDTFDNCAISYLEEAINGSVVFYLLHLKEPHLVSFEKVIHEWWLHQNFRAHNEMPLPAARDWVIDYCRKHGIEAGDRKITMGLDLEAFLGFEGGGDQNGTGERVEG